MTELPTMELPTHLMKPGVMYRVVHTGGHPELRVGDQVYVASRAGNAVSPGRGGLRIHKGGA